MNDLAEQAPPLDAAAYSRDSYLRSLAAEVLAVDGNGAATTVVLSNTVLFPEGGGQPSDSGWIDDLPVVMVSKVGAEIRHLLADSVVPPQVGATVLARVDWARRFDHMQQHTAQHLLSAIAEDRCGWSTTSFHLGAERCDVELAVESLSRGAAEQLEQWVAQAVREAHPIRVRWVEPDDLATLTVRSRGLPPGHQGLVRLVEIEGIDIATCGGTHLLNTAEIEAVKLLHSEPMRGGMRLHFLAGDRVRRRLGHLEEVHAELRTVFDAAEGELADRARAAMQTLTEQKKANRSRTEQWAALWVAKTIRDGVDCGVLDCDAEALRNVARLWSASSTDRWALLCAPRDGAFVLVRGAGSRPAAAGDPEGPSLAAGFQELLGILEARGGGKDRLFQGRFAPAGEPADAGFHQRWLLAVEWFRRGAN